MAIQGNLEKKRNKLVGSKKRKKENGSEVGAEIAKGDMAAIKEKKLEKKRNKLVGSKKRKKENGSEVGAEIAKGDMATIKEKKLEKKRNKLVGNKKRKMENGNIVSAEIVEQLFSQDKSEKVEKKKKKKNRLSSKEVSKLTEKKSESVTDGVYQISSGDRDCSKGIKKWVTEYHRSRPGLEVLQQRIDEFITDHEEREEQARQEREALAAEGGWTVVVHHKGRKKTTDSESGTTVGSVAQAAVEDKMAKKKSKEVGDFYRFQKREAQMNEVMSLQSKFEQDKKRIQMLRAARKFKPY